MCCCSKNLGGQMMVMCSGHSETEYDLHTEDPWISPNFEAGETNLKRNFVYSIGYYFLGFQQLQLSSVSHVFNGKSLVMKSQKHLNRIQTCIFDVYLNCQLPYIGISSIQMLLHIPFVDGMLWCIFSTAKFMD